jgi:hypothetical protein
MPQHQAFSNHANRREKSDVHASQFNVAFVTLLECLNQTVPYQRRSKVSNNRESDSS